MQRTKDVVGAAGKLGFLAAIVGHFDEVCGSNPRQRDAQGYNKTQQHLRRAKISNKVGTQCSMWPFVFLSLTFSGKRSYIRFVWFETSDDLGTNTAENAYHISVECGPTTRWSTNHSCDQAEGFNSSGNVHVDNVRQ